MHFSSSYVPPEIPWWNYFISLGKVDRDAPYEKSASTEDTPAPSRAAVHLPPRISHISSSLKGRFLGKILLDKEELTEQEYEVSLFLLSSKQVILNTSSRSSSEFEIGIGWELLRFILTVLNEAFLSGEQKDLSKCLQKAKLFAR